MNNSIIEFLNLKEEEIASLTCQSTDEGLFVFLSLKVKPHPCPTCGTTTSKIMNRYERKINHGLFIDRRCMIYYRQNRYQCPICQTTFNEVCSLATKHQKKSMASHIQMMELLRDPHLTFKKSVSCFILLRRPLWMLFISPYRFIHLHYPEYFALMRFIWEETQRRNTSRSYWILNRIRLWISFMEEPKMLYTVISSDYPRSNYERSNSSVRICMKDIVFLQRHYFKQAKLCVDSFHVIQLILSMMDAQLKGFLRHYDRGSLEYYLLKQKRFVLLRNASSIEWYRQEYNRKLGYIVYLMKYRELLFNIHPAH
jgi:hypothetical protein